MKNGDLARKRALAGYLFVLPGTLVLVVFIIVPLIASLASSFFTYTIMLDHFQFVGFQNYHTVLTDNRFWNSLKNTLYFTAVVVPVSNLVSLSVALAISRNTRLNVGLRTIYFLPVVCSMAIVAMALAMMFNYNIGIIPAAFRRMGIPVVDLLKSKVWAMPTVILISVYKGFGFNMVIFIASRQSVPAQLYEAADMDGARPFDKLRSITLPSMASTIAFAFITSIIGSFQVFDQVFVTTKGGPLFRTETAVQLIYQRAFGTYEMGIANADAFLLFLLILVVTLAVRRISSGAETVE